MLIFRDGHLFAADPERLAGDEPDDSAGRAEIRAGQSASIQEVVPRERPGQLNKGPRLRDAHRAPGSTDSGQVLEQETQPGIDRGLELARERQSRR